MLNHITPDCIPLIMLVAASGVAILDDEVLSPATVDLPFTCTGCPLDVCHGCMHEEQS